MRKPKIYLDTSVISHLKQEDVPDKMNDTLRLWEDIKAGYYDVYISMITLNEINDNASSKRTVLLECLSEIEYTIITINDEIRDYANKINSMGILSNKHYDDCLHIACSVISGCNYLLSWNFKHIVRVKTVNGIRSINAMMGYHGIDIYPPSMLVGLGDD